MPRDETSGQGVAFVVEAIAARLYEQNKTPPKFLYLGEGDWVAKKPKQNYVEIKTGACCSPSCRCCMASTTAHRYPCSKVRRTLKAKAMEPTLCGLRRLEVVSVSGFHGDFLDVFSWRCRRAASE